MRIMRIQEKENKNSDIETKRNSYNNKNNTRNNNRIYNNHYNIICLIHAQQRYN